MFSWLQPKDCHAKARQPRLKQSVKPLESNGIPQSMLRCVQAHLVWVYRVWEKKEASKTLAKSVRNPIVEKPV